MEFLGVWFWCLVLVFRVFGLLGLGFGVRVLDLGFRFRVWGVHSLGRVFALGHGG